MNHVPADPPVFSDRDSWFRTYRCIISSPVFADSELLKLWIWLLAKASHQERHMTLRTGGGSKVVTLLRGQCIVGRMKSAEELLWKPSTFRDRLSRLEAMGMISIKADTNWSVVTITNWLRFQRPNGASTTGRRHADDKLTTGRRHIQECIESIEGKESKKVETQATTVAEIDPDLLEWIKWWNSLKAKNLVLKGVDIEPGEGLLAAWKRVKKSKALKAHLSDRDVLEAKIRNQAFLHDASWFSLPKLLGGKNQDRELIVQNILDDRYTVSSSSKPRSANVGPGVRFDPSKKDNANGW